MEKIGIGFVGAGWMGKALLQRLRERDDVEIRALLNRDPSRGKAVLRELGLAEDLLAKDYQSILDNPAVDTVWLVNPNSYHGPQALAAMRAGKHVFCEKPCATRYQDFCEQIAMEKARPDLITFVDYILNFDTMQERIHRMVAEGAFGKLTQIQVNYRHPVNIAGEKQWKLKKDIMGDAIGMGIIHALSVMLKLMSSQTKPVGVFATSQPAQVRGFEADPIWSILVRFENGASGFCFGNIDSGNGYDAYHSLYGTQGAFVFDSQQPRPTKVRYWSADSAGGAWVFPLDAEACERQNVGSLAWSADTTTPDSGNVIEHQTGAVVAHFIDCVKAGSQSPLSFANSAAIGEVGWAALMSAQTGREIRLPLDRRETSDFFRMNDQGFHHERAEGRGNPALA